MTDFDEGCFKHYATRGHLILQISKCTSQRCEQMVLKWEADSKFWVMQWVWGKILSKTEPYCTPVSEQCAQTL